MTRVWAGRMLGVLAVVSCLCSAGTATADKAAAGKLYDKGFSRYEDGKYRDALRLFKAARVLLPASRRYERARNELRYFIGMCHLKLGRPKRALGLLRRYLEGPGAAERHRKAAAVVSRLRGRSGPGPRKVERDRPRKERPGAPPRWRPGWSVLGGELAGGVRRAITVGVGLPGIFGQITFGGSPSFNLALRAEFLYAGWGIDFGSIGGSFSVPMRIGISRGGGFEVALSLSPGVTLASIPLGQGYVSSIGVIGFQAGVGVPVSIKLGRKARLILSLDIPLTVFKAFEGGGIVVAVPIHFGVGIEVRFSPRWTLFLYPQGGPVVLAGEGGSAVDGNFKFAIGMHRYW